MKKTLFVLMLSLVTVFGMAQGRHGGSRGNDRGHGRGPGREYPHEMHHQPCATPEQMQLVLQVIDNQSFDDKKLEIGKLCVVLGHFCTNDLARIAEKFSFDDNRKAFLIYAYPYCVDRRSAELLFAEGSIPVPLELRRDDGEDASGL